jgi:hypothetical protein
MEWIGQQRRWQRRNHEKENPPNVLCGEGSGPRPTRSVRGSSRRIMTLRFRPAYIRVINRRVRSGLSSALLFENRMLEAHHQERVPGWAARRGYPGARTAHSRQGYATPLRALACCAPFWPREIATGGSTQEHFNGSCGGKRKGWLPSWRRRATLIQNSLRSVRKGIDRSLHISNSI